MKNTTMLLIMDGFGMDETSSKNAISCANTPNLDRLFKECPNTLINASGNFVGLPDGQMGNSEVGHTNIGAGRVVWQELSKITNDIREGSFFENEELRNAMISAKEKGTALHFMGLLSDGGVHSHIDHLFALIKLAKEIGPEKVFVHVICDGRDVAPGSGIQYIRSLEDYMKETGCGKIADVSGRYYAMDRDKRWERLQLAYDLYTLGEGHKACCAEKLFNEAIERGETDEFIVPGAVENIDGTIKDNDSVIFYNFRPDRAREITRALVDPDFDGFARKKTVKGLNYVCFTTYDATIPNVKTAFKPQSLKNTLGEYISSLGLKQLRIAETEKYAHVTFFFNGGIEQPYEGEERILINSPKVATYDLMPEMSAYPVTDAVIKEIESKKHDLIIMNLANCDMVGHTGIFDAAVKAVEAVDQCVGKVAKAIEEAGGNLLITADHGNADCMFNEDNTPCTTHTTNLVPLIYLGKEKKTFKKIGALCDLAPTLLDLMNLPIPPEMEGTNLLS